jgi:hypothetical protein
VELEIPTPTDFVQIAKFQSRLREIPNLGLISIGGSSSGGTIIVVVSETPRPLLGTLRAMPLVRDAVKKGKGIQVTLEPRQA